jgi:hypothetical protein
VYFSGSIDSEMSPSDLALPQKTLVPVRYVFLRMGVSVAVQASVEAKPLGITMKDSSAEEITASREFNASICSSPQVGHPY